MIIVVDDDESFREMLQTVLSKAGHEMKTFGAACDALLFCETVEPDVIISDILMPDMNGYDFRRQYAGLFPHRKTAFIFLSSLADSSDIVKGLEHDVDDYITKPVDAEVLKAKLNSVVRRRHRYSFPSFRGDIAKFPFMNLLKFCETRGLTGRVEIVSHAVNAAFQVTAGTPHLDELADENVEALYDINEGIFTIYSQPVDFQELLPSLAPSAAPANEKKALSSKDMPMGILSGVRCDDRLFQVQTEFVTVPDNQIVTLVILNGKIMHKQVDDIDEGALERNKIEKMMKIQHGEVERNIKSKLNSLAQDKKTEESGQEQAQRLFSEGFEKYRSRDFDGALSLWQKGLELNPSDKTLATNIKMLKKKLGLE